MFFIDICDGLVGAQNQFEIKAGLINSFGIRYDLKSVMHYGPKAFSKNNKNTIEAIYPNVCILFLLLENK